MPADTPVPLATSADLLSGAFADLVRGYQLPALDQMMIEATRQCEGICGRRLAPFQQVPESHRAQGIDPDEYTDSANLPLDIQGTLGRSYSNALGGSDQVRHVWLNEYAARYPEMWTYSNLQVTILRSYGGTQQLAQASLIGAENDSGHVWFSLGTFLPVGSLIRVLYDGGYSTIPADLTRACVFVTASMAVTELDPLGQVHGHDPDALMRKAEDILLAYERT